jgi:Spy/CpxP family protein refolding chaperone
MRPFALAFALALSAASGAAAQHAGHAPAAPYAGQQTRTVTSFSEEDLAELRRGGGWGLAKPAELNGWPGPAHLLELARELDLSAEQQARIRELFEAMQRQAVAAGARLIEAEAALDAAFRERRVTRDRLESLLAEAEAARRALRFVHLAAHLEMPALLTPAQIARYEVLRGYRGDVCAGGPPAGHDPALWRRHTGCP